MKVKARMQKMAALIEFVVSAVLAVFFHMALHEQAVALTVFGVGLLLSLATWLLREDINEIREKLLEEYREFHELPDAMRRIEDPECLKKAREIIARITRNMSLLQRGFIPMDETEFMMEATKAADAAQQTLRSVNPLTPGWDTRGVIIKYYQANRRALERGVKVTRTFVMRRDQLAEAEVQKLLRTHHMDGIEVKVAYRDELPAGEEVGWAKDCSYNFGVFDNKIVVDVSAPVPYYGVKTTQRAELVRYLRMLDLVDHASHGVALRDDEIVQI
ncbi:MAG TPA: hypothetical protein VN642_13235 [Dongiaceae bacterium]|nr:hypothetical protein [Dongiaceae bacterium]